jgi:hypothetical protein
MVNDGGLNRAYKLGQAFEVGKVPLMKVEPVFDPFEAPAIGSWPRQHVYLATKFDQSAGETGAHKTGGAGDEKPLFGEIEHREPDDSIRGSAGGFYEVLRKSRKPL